MLSFWDRIRIRWTEGKHVCIGLDSEVERIPPSALGRHIETTGVGATISRFNYAIIDATADLACAYKPNIAFYEQHGPAGWQALQQTIAYIHEHAPSVPVILDAKRADIGNTNRGYVAAAFEYLGADAITVHPYLGQEALQPLLERGDKGVFVLCRTSNPGAGEFQDLLIEGRPLYQVVAQRVAHHWNQHHNCALVVGATYPDELRQVRHLVGDLPILIPGIGAQGGDVEAAVNAGRDSQGHGIVINSSRAIIFASKAADFAAIARQKTMELHQLIKQYLAYKH